MNLSFVSQGPYSLIIVCSYRYDVVSLCNWIEESLEKHLNGTHPVNCFIETKESTHIAHIKVGRSIYVDYSTVQQSDLIVALDVHALLKNPTILSIDTTCLVADVLCDDSGLEEDVPYTTKEEVSEFLQRRSATGYWLPLFENFVMEDALSSNAKLIATQGAICAFLGIGRCKDTEFLDRIV